MQREEDPPVASRQGQPCSASHCIPQAVAATPARGPCSEAGNFDSGGASPSPYSRFPELGFRNRQPRVSDDIELVISGQLRFPDIDTCMLSEWRSGNINRGNGRSATPLSAAGLVLVCVCV